MRVNGNGIICMPKSEPKGTVLFDTLEMMGVEDGQKREGGSGSALHDQRW